MKTKILITTTFILLTSVAAFTQTVSDDLENKYDRIGENRMINKRNMREHKQDNDRHLPRHRKHHKHFKRIHNIYEICRYAGIELNNDQIDKMNSIIYEYDTKINDFEYKKRNVDYKIRLEKGKIDLDLNTIKNLINEKKDIEKDIDYLKIEKLISIYDIFTKEQSDTLKRMYFYK